MATPAAAAGVFVLHLEGDNEAPAAERVRYDLAAAVESGTALIFDLSHATSIGPRVISLLVDGVARCEDDERACLLLLPDTCPAQVRGSFERYGLTSLLPVVRSWDEALARAGPPGAVTPRHH